MGIENSFYRNVHVWHHPKLPIQFTTYPIIPYGNAGFFRKINAELPKFRNIISDKLVWNKYSSNLAESQRFVFKNQGFVKPKKVKVIDVEERNKIMQQSFFHFMKFRLLVERVCQPVINFLLKSGVLEKYIRVKLHRKDSIRKRYDEFKPLFDLLFKDQIKQGLSDEIVRYHNHFKNKNRIIKAAIICDGQKMALAFRILKNLGYKWQLKERIKVF